MANFNAAPDFQGALAVWAGIALDHIAQIFHAAQGYIAFPVYAGQVVAFLVGSADKVHHVCRTAIDNDRHWQVHGADGAGLATDNLFDFLIGGHGQRFSDIGQVFRLDFIKGVIPPKNQGNQATVAVVVFFGLNQQGLGAATGVYLQERGNGLYGPLLWCGHLRHFFRRR